MKLIKITDDHYVIVDENAEIEEGDWYVGLHNKVIKATDGKHYAAEAVKFSGKPIYKITHSTQPLESLKIDSDVANIQYVSWGDIKYLPFQEVKELLGKVDVKKKAINSWEGCDSCDTNDELFFINGYQRGYNQALEDNKEKKYTEENMIDFSTWRNITCFDPKNPITSKWEFEVWKSFQFPTQWNVEFDSQYKLKLV